MPTGAGEGGSSVSLGSQRGGSWGIGELGDSALFLTTGKTPEIY